MHTGKRIIIGLCLILPFTASGSDFTETALKFVPGGKVVQEKIKEVKVQTPKGSIVEIEFERNGTFEEASGDNLDQDIFVPEEGRLPLQKVVAELIKQGKSPKGEWSMEHSFFKGWHYEFEGYENGLKYDYVVDAKSGKLIASEIDD
jgi:uncharacterized membrane protein YkoI